MKRMLIGVDIGGTKCAVCRGEASATGIHILERQVFPTPASPTQALAQIIATIEIVKGEHAIEAIGISCGGPLDSQRGMIYAPPNLPLWDSIDVVTPVRECFGIPVGLQNDANAGALAEWQWGAGQGCQNLIFLTFGTGMGAGLILNGALYTGTNDLAGEVGHMRLASHGPLGYGKAGSFEGFCSGGGIANLARQMARERLQAGEAVGYCPTPGELDQVTAARVGEAAQAGDPIALRVWETVARRLGQGLALLVDLLNPERIILGSIYLRQRQLLEPLALQILQAEALPGALAMCQIVPAGLNEDTGDAASLAVAQHLLASAMPF